MRGLATSCEKRETRSSISCFDRLGGGMGLGGALGPVAGQGRSVLKYRFGYTRVPVGPDAPGALIEPEIWLP
jgi:hypothetical protein